LKIFGFLQISCDGIWLCSNISYMWTTKTIIVLSLRFCRLWCDGSICNTLHRSSNDEPWLVDDRRHIQHFAGILNVFFSAVFAMLTGHVCFVAELNLHERSLKNEHYLFIFSDLLASVIANPSVIHIWLQERHLKIEINYLDSSTRLSLYTFANYDIPLKQSHKTPACSPKPCYVHIQTCCLVFLSGFVLF